MNENIKDLYIQFHTKRRLFIEEEAEKQFQEMVADDWSESPTTRMEALFVVMGKRNEQMDFEEYAKLIINICVEICDEQSHLYGGKKTANGECLKSCGNHIKNYFGIDK